MKKVLIVEDDVNLGTTIAGSLTMVKMNVCFSDGNEDVFKLFESFRPDIVLLDVLIGSRKAGYEIASKIRTTYLTPIIFITALDTPQDLRKAFSFDNVDYISKPFIIIEVILRINKILSRKSSYNMMDNFYQLAGYKFYPDENSLTTGEEEVHINNCESAVLKLLCRNINCFVNRNEIITTVWGVEDCKMKEGSLNNTISSLRKRFASEPRIKIVTLIKVGVKLSMEL